MLEDILLIGEHHRRAAQAIVKEILARRQPKFIVAISGESGSGKSELTHVIAKELFQMGIVAKPVHTDNFYKTLPLERNAFREANGVELVVGSHEYDWEAIQMVVERFKAGEICEMPCVDLVTQRVDRLVTDFSEIDMLVMDGLYAIKTEGTDFNIMIDLTYLETKRSQILRGKEKTDEFRYRVLDTEHLAVTKLRPLAHLFVGKDYKVYSPGNKKYYYNQ